MFRNNYSSSYSNPSTRTEGNILVVVVFDDDDNNDDDVDGDVEHEKEYELW